MADTDEVQKETGVVSGNISRPSRFGVFSSKKVLLVVVPLVVIVLIVGGLLYWTGRGEQDNGPVSDPNDPINKYNSLVASQGDEKAAEAIKNDASLAASREGKMLLASAAFNQGKYDEALKLYEEIAKQYGMNANIAQQMAVIYTQKQDVARAVEYYEKAKELYKADTTNPLREAEIQSIDRIIAELKQ